MNGRILSGSASRKRRFKSSWSRGLVPKVYKKKKISFEDDGNVSGNPSAQDIVQGIDLEKFQEFEKEMQGAVNGHVFNNSAESDNDNDIECDRESDNNSPMELYNKVQESSENCVEVGNVEAKQNATKDGASVSRREFHSPLVKEADNVDDLNFEVDSDCSLSAFSAEERDRVIIDREELKNVYDYTLNSTADFPIELLCDTYVQLSRRIGQYRQIYDRKSLPKVSSIFYLY